MASVSRKLVHKQFNSPIGLYSDQNVKETLDRELKACNGDVGIDLNDIPRAPFNLINSSVLKMVAEEDYEKTHLAPRKITERQSRPRQRQPIITREDVLKINRRRPRRRDISWPPSDDQSRSRSSSEEIHFDESIRKRNEIFHLREMFDKGAIDSTTSTTITEATTTNERNNLRPSSKNKIASRSRSQDVAWSPDSNRGHGVDFEFNAAYQSAKRSSRPSYRQKEWSPQTFYYENESDNVILSERTFYLPESELHIGNIEPIRAYWRNISARSSSSSPVRYRTDDQLKRWRSHDNITSAHFRGSGGPYSSQLETQVGGNSHKKDNLPLERNKSNSYNELPPLKPRREDHKTVHCTKKKLNLNNSKQATKRIWDAGCWVSDEGVNLNTQNSDGVHLKIDANKVEKGVDVNEDIKSVTTTQRMSPAKQTSPQHLHNYNNFNYGLVSNVVESQTATARKDCGKSSLQQLHQNENNSKRNDNQKRSTVRFSDELTENAPVIKTNISSTQSPKQIPITFEHQPNMNITSHDQQVLTEAAKRLALHEKTKMKALSYLNQFKSQESGPSEKTENEANKGQAESHERIVPIMQTADNKNDWSQKEHTPFDRGAGQMSPNQFTCKGNDQTESLLLKRNLMEEAITQDIQRINEYMKRAEQEALSADRYANESIAITPLQAILKQIVVPKSLIVASDSISSSAATNPFPFSTVAMAMHVENMPVVDQALIELVALSRTLEAFDSTNNSTDNNSYPNQARITELRNDGTEKLEGVSVVNAAAISNIQNWERDLSPEQDSGPDFEAETEAVDSTTESTTSRTASGTPVDKVIHSKNILSGYLITKQSQEELFKTVHLSEMDTGVSGNVDYTETFSSDSSKLFQPELSSAAPQLSSSSHEKTLPPSNSCPVEYPSKHNMSYYATDTDTSTPNEADYNREQPLQINKNICNELLNNASSSLESNPPPSWLSSEKIMCLEGLTDSRMAATKTSEYHDKLIEGSIKLDQQGLYQVKDISLEQATIASTSNTTSQMQSSGNESPSCHPSIESGKKLDCNRKTDSSCNVPWRRNRKQVQHEHNELQTDKLEKTEITTSSSSPLAECNYEEQNRHPADRVQDEDFSGYDTDDRISQYRSRCRTRLGQKLNNRFRSSSQPSSTQREHALPSLSPLVRQHSFDSSESRFYASPRLYMSGHFSPGRGYKRVAWPPVDTAPVYATVPQPQNPPPSNYESSQNEYQPQATQAFQPVNSQQSAVNYQTQNYMNNIQPQQQQQVYYQQNQRQASPYVRGQSPGVIQLRKEPPISQQPAPVYTSQPATATLRDDISFTGGSNMRGDLKWPPPEYKAQAAVENEERRKIALGPVCRPRRVQKDYSSFFAKNALNHYYPGYKIPPGTQHMYTQY